ALGVQAQNLVQNPGFEDLTAFNNWNTANHSGFLTVDDGTSSLFVPNNGNYYALFGGSGDAIDQSLPTTAGGYYEVSFWVNDKFGQSDFVANWGQSQLLHLPFSYNSGGANNGWVNFQFVVPGSSAVDLSFVNATGTVGLDDVSVSAVPEPMSYG